MSLDSLSVEIEEIESDGAVVLVKWDGDRESLHRTVVITRQNTNYIFRRDTEDIVGTLRDAIADYWTAHPKSRAAAFGRKQPFA